MHISDFLGHKHPSPSDDYGQLLSEDCWGLKRGDGRGKSSEKPSPRVHVPTGIRTRPHERSTRIPYSTTVNIIHLFDVDVTENFISCRKSQSFCIAILQCLTSSTPLECMLVARAVIYSTIRSCANVMCYMPLYCLELTAITY